jgi:hypothetical protein
MTALNRAPSNPNFLHANKFTLSFDRVPNVQYFVQSVSVPGISLSEVQRSTPFVDLYSPGEKAIYDSLVVTFHVDEELRGWKEIHDWIRAMTFPTDFGEYESLKKLNRNIPVKDMPQYSQASLTLYTSSNTPQYRFRFVDCFPTSLSSFLMAVNDSPENPITADVTLRYAYYNIDKIG